MRERDVDQKEQSRAPEPQTTKEREKRRPRIDTRVEGDPDNPQICRGID